MLEDVKEIVYDLIDEAYSEAPDDFFPTLERARRMVDKAQSPDEVASALEEIGFGPIHVRVFLHSGGKDETENTSQVGENSQRDAPRGAGGHP